MCPMLTSIFSRNWQTQWCKCNTELLIIHFKWYGIIAQSTALFTCTHVHNRYTCTHMFTYTPAAAVSGTSWALWCVLFPPLPSDGERPVAAEGSPLLWDRGLFKGNLRWGTRRVSQGSQKHFSYGQANYSAGVMHLCGGLGAAVYPCRVLKNFYCSTLGVHPPPKDKFFEFKISESASAGYSHLI